MNSSSNKSPNDNRHLSSQAKVGGSPDPLAGGLPVDKISRIDCYTVPPRWLFVRVETQNGLLGWGEGTLEGGLEAVEGAFVALRERLLGANPFQIEEAWQIGYRTGFYRGGPILMSAISGLDQALWDIKGRALNIPVWELLGGRVRDRVACYSWVGGDRPHDIQSAARLRRQQGFRSLKMNATPELAWLSDIGQFDAVLERVSTAKAEGMNVALDFHGRLHKPMAKQLARLLEPLAPLFIEEPLLPENIDAFAQLAGLTTIPIAAGERLFTRWDYKPFFERGLIDVAQPDISHAGGISEGRRIAAMAELYDVAIAPHCPLGPIGFAAALQLGASTPNFVISEMSIGMHYNNAGSDLLTYLKDPAVFDIVDGCVSVPSGPGLGIQIDEVKVREAARGFKPWRPPVWRLDDGSITEW